MIRFILLLSVFLCLPFASAMANDVAEKTDTLKIAVVDIQQLMSGSKAAQSIQSQGRDLRNKYQKQIKKTEDGLKETEKKLVELSKGESEEEFNKKKAEFQKKLIDGQKEAAELNQKLDRAVGEALNILRDKIVEIVGNMAADNQYDLVISRADVVIVSKNIDITAAVLKKLDNQLKTVKVKG